MANFFGVTICLNASTRLITNITLIVAKVAQLIGLCAVVEYLSTTGVIPQHKTVTNTYCDDFLRAILSIGSNKCVSALPIFKKYAPTVIKNIPNIPK